MHQPVDPVYVLLSAKVIQAVSVREGLDDQLVWSAHLFMVGTAPWIKEKHEYRLLERYKRGRNRACRRQNKEDPVPDFFPDPKVFGVLAGGEDEAERLRSQLLWNALECGEPILGIKRENRPEDEFHLFAWTREYLHWFGANSQLWDGHTDAEALGVERITNPPIISEREARRRMQRSRPGLDPRSRPGRNDSPRRRTLGGTEGGIRLLGEGLQWNGPAAGGEVCPVCQGRPRDLVHCLACDRSGFLIKEEPIRATEGAES